MCVSVCSSEADVCICLRCAEAELCNLCAMLKQRCAVCCAEAECVYLCAMF